MMKAMDVVYALSITNTNVLWDTQFHLVAVKEVTNHSNFRQNMCIHYFIVFIYLFYVSYNEMCSLCLAIMCTKICCCGWKIYINMEEQYKSLIGHTAHKSNCWEIICHASLFSGRYDPAFTAPPFPWKVLLPCNYHASLSLQGTTALHLPCLLFPRRYYPAFTMPSFPWKALPCIDDVSLFLEGSILHLPSLPFSGRYFSAFPMLLPCIPYLLCPGMFSPAWTGHPALS